MPGSNSLLGASLAAANSVFPGASKFDYESTGVRCLPVAPVMSTDPSVFVAVARPHIQLSNSDTRLSTLTCSARHHPRRCLNQGS